MVDYDLGKVVGDKGDTGNGIASIELISTSGKVKTYRITFTDGDHFDYQVSDGADGSSGIADIVTSWSATLHDDKVPSEKLAKNSLDAKLDNAISSTAVTIASNDNILITDYSDSNKVKRVSSILASQMKDSNAHSNIGSSANASQSTINTNIDTALSGKANSSSLSTVATTGSYNDLTNKPTIPSISGLEETANKVTSWSTTTTDAHYPSEKLVKTSLDAKANSSSLSTVATSGSYNDLSNKPTLFSGSYADLSNKPSYTATITSSTTGAYEIGKINVSGSSQTIYGKDTGGTSVDIVTAWETTPSDSKVASEKLVKDSLDGKLDNAISSTAVSIASNDDILITDYSDSNKVKRVANILATQVKDSNAHSNIGSSASATQGTINTNIDTALSNKVSKSSTSGLLKNDGTIDTSTYLTSSALSNYVQKSSTNGLLKNDGTVDTTSYSTFSGSYSDLSNKPSIPSSSSDLSDGSDLVKKSQTTGLLKNDGTVMVSGTGSSNWAVGNHTHSGYLSATKVTSWQSTPSDSNVPSEKLVLDTIDSLVGDARIMIIPSRKYITSAEETDVVVKLTNSLGQGLSDKSVTVYDGTTTYNGTTDTNGEYRLFDVNVLTDTTFTATYGTVTATCTVEAVLVWQTDEVSDTFTTTTSSSNVFSTGGTWDNTIDWIAYFDFKATANGKRIDIVPPSETRNHHLGIGVNGSGSLGMWTGKSGTGENTHFFPSQTFNKNTYYSISVKKEGSSVTFTCENQTFTINSLTWLSNYSTETMKFTSWNNAGSIYIKNIRVKAL